VSNLYLTVSRSLDESAAPEAFGWLNTAALVGGALGTALAGVAGDRVGPQGAFLAATLLAVVAAACPAVVLVARRLPGREPD
jgi:MFS family permease